MAGPPTGNVGAWPWAMLSIAVIAVSSAGAVLQGMSEVPPLLRASWRMQGTSVVLLPGFIFQLTRVKGLRLEALDFLVMLASSIFLAIHFGSWVWSLDNTSLIHSLLFVNSHPLVLVALMPIMGASIRKRHIFGASIGFIGAAITLIDIGDGGQVSIAGDAAAFLGAVTVVGYLLAGRHLRSERQVPIFIYAFPVTLGAGIWLSITTIAFEGSSMASIAPESSLVGWTDLSWLLWVAYLSLGPGLCGHTGINTVLRWISPIVVSIVLLFEPVLGGIIGFMLTGKSILGPFTVIGGILMISGAILVTLEEGSETADESSS